MKNTYLQIKEKLGASLAEWTLASKTEFIDAEKADKELISIAEKRGISIPSQDLAIFKTIYCEIEKPNGNGVTITAEGAAKGIESAVGKQINFNHEGFHQICGWILDAKIEGKFVIIYGALFKTAIREDFETVKNMFADGSLYVSFELHTMDLDGTFVAERRDDGIIYVTKMLISGCGLLIKPNEKTPAPAPACPKARVLQMIASKKILEDLINLKAKNDYDIKLAEDIIFAELYMQDQKCGQCGTCENKKKVRIKTSEIKSEYWECPYCEKEIEEKELYFDGAKWFHRPCQDKGEIILPSKNIDGKEMKTVDEIIDADYEGGEIEEAKKLTTEQRNTLPDSDFALIQEQDGKKIRRFPINDEAHVRNALARLPQAKDITEEERKQCLNKILKKAKELKMKDIVEKYKAELDAMVASGEIVEPPTVPEKKIVKIITQDITVSTDVPQDNGFATERKRTIITVRSYDDGSEDRTEEQITETDQFSRAQLEEKVATAKAEVEATIPDKIKAAEDKIKSDKDSEIAILKAENEEKEKQIKSQLEAIIAAKDIEINNLKTIVDSEKNTAETFKAELEIKKYTDEDIKLAKDNAAKLIARRILLEDANSEIDEKLLLDDKEFEILKLKKENSALKASKKGTDFVVTNSKNELDTDGEGSIMATLVNKYCQIER